MEEVSWKLESAHSMLESIESFRMSEILFTTPSHITLDPSWRVIHNAQHLIGVVERWEQRGGGPDGEAMDELVEMVFNALHRWFSWKTFAQLPKRSPPSSAMSLPKESERGSCATDAEGRAKDLLQGDPWQDADDLAAEDLLEYMADSMQRPIQNCGVLRNPHDAYTASARSDFSRGLCKSDLMRLSEVSTCASLSSRPSLAMPSSKLSVSRDCSVDSNATVLGSDRDVWADSGKEQDHHFKKAFDLMRHQSPRVETPRQKLVDVICVDCELAPSQLADAEASLEAKRQQLAEAELALQAQQATVTEAAATATKAAAAVAELAARFAAERNAPSPQVQAFATAGSPAQGEHLASISSARSAGVAYSSDSSLARHEAACNCFSCLLGYTSHHRDVPCDSAGS